MPVREKIPVIIDTDPGVDDTLAILLALASPELEILAIVISFGNTDVEASYVNVLKLYQAMAFHFERHPEDGQRFPNFFSSKPILARGATGPLYGDLHSAQCFHGRDGLGNITERHPDLDLLASAQDISLHPQLILTDKSGPEVALDLIRSHPIRSITYIALGPLTSLAHAVRLDAIAFRDRVGCVVCMGGALDVPGNKSPVAEFNFFADPYAVKELLFPSHPGVGIPIDRFILIPLDITTPHELPFPVYKERVDPSFESPTAPSVGTCGKPPLTHFTSSFLEMTREIMLSFGKDALELHDIVAVWCAIDNPPVASEVTNGMPTLGKGWKGLKRVFDIERTGELTRGMLVIDRRDDQIAYVPGTNRAKAQAELELLLADRNAVESGALPAQAAVECRDDLHKRERGVVCVIDTPGPEALLQVLLERVWGISDHLSK